MMFSVETRLAMAAAFNGSMLESRFLTEGNLRNYVLWHMQDYFRYTPMEGSQFDSAKVLAELEAVPDNGAGHAAFLGVLGDIGFRSRPSCDAAESRDYTLEPLLWERFINEAVKERRQEKKEEAVPLPR